MRNTVRRVCAAVLCTMLVTGLTACTSKAQREANAAYEQAMKEYQRQADELEALRAETEAAESVVDEYIACVNALIGGESFARIDGRAEYTAEAVVPEGMKVDYWLLNGERTEGGETLTFPAAGGTVAEAVLRPEKKLTAINSLMCLVDENENVISEPFTELNFEDKDSVSVRVYAETDDLTTVDHWIVNGVAVDVYGFVLQFCVHDVDEALTVEPVFAACYTRHEGPDPTPRYQQVPLAYGQEGAK